MEKGVRPAGMVTPTSVFPPMPSIAFPPVFQAAVDPVIRLEQRVLGLEVSVKTVEAQMAGLISHMSDSVDKVR